MEHSLEKNSIQKIAKLIKKKLNLLNSTVVTIL